MNVQGIDLPANLSDGHWHPVVVTMSPGRVTKLYVNGVQQPLPEDD